MPGRYSCLRVDFHFQRNTFPWLRDVYLPMAISILIVWLSSWMDVEQMGRVWVLGSAIFYCKWIAFNHTATTLRLISYSTSFHWWSWGCDVLIGWAILEFVVVQRLSSVERGKCRSCQNFMEIVMRIGFLVGFAMVISCCYVKYLDQNVE